MTKEYLKAWYPLDEFPNSQYEINRMGQIRNKKTNQLLKGTVTSGGYLSYLLTIDGKAYSRKAHILVARQFIPNPHGYPVVNHIDEDKLNPCVTNLEWVTYAANISHGTAQHRSEARRSKPICEYDLDGHYIRTWKSVKHIYLFYNLPYDRNHRPTYLIKILANNDDPNSEKIIFAGRVFIRYTGSTHDVEFTLKESFPLRNDTYKQLIPAKNVPNQFLLSQEDQNGDALNILNEMIHSHKFPFSRSQISAIEYAIVCIQQLQDIITDNE